MNDRCLTRSGRSSVSLKKHRGAETVAFDLWCASADRCQVQSKVAHVFHLGCCCPRAASAQPCAETCPRDRNHRFTPTTNQHRLSNAAMHTRRPRWVRLDCSTKWTPCPQHPRLLQNAAPRSPALRAITGQPTVGDGRESACVAFGNVVAFASLKIGDRWGFAHD
jgi:hypothetical protein